MLLYDVARRALFVIPPLILPVQFFISAPFGRFTPSTDSIFLLDGIRAWIIMELVAPLAFLYVLANDPLSFPSSSGTPLTAAQIVLTALFLVHYANRALISPLRTPSRSKQHAVVTLFAVIFNIVNGMLVGTYLASSSAHAYLAHAFQRPTFWAGTALWVTGFVGNIIHDEVLLNIRRNARTKGKARAKSPPAPGASHNRKREREYYGVPHGYLYAYVSYPNYFCEWLEWCGFALAAAPFPDVSSLTALVDSVHPPWIFFLAEVCLMIGRAYKGHRWYLANFPDYPKDRRVVIPFVF